MDEEFIKKCFENWQMIVSYIDNNFECQPVKELEIYSSKIYGSLTECYLYKSRQGVYVATELYSGYKYRENFTMSEIKYNKYGNIENLYHIEPFCKIIAELCLHWNIIKKNIELLKNARFTVMNFNTEHCVVETKKDYIIKVFSSYTDKLVQTIPEKYLRVNAVTEAEIHNIANGICIGLKCKYTHAFVDVFIDGEEVKLFREFLK